MSEPVPDTASSLPAPVLRPFIRAYAGFRANGFPGHMDVAASSTDVSMVITLGEPIDIERMPNAERQPTGFHALVGGLRESPIHIRRDREAFGLHVFINPLGVRAILGVSSVELASLIVRLSDIWGSASRRLGGSPTSGENLA